VKSFKDALSRHKEIPAPPAGFVELQQHFQSVPPSSFDALLIKMGPFKAERDAFHFSNGAGGGWAINQFDAPAVRERLNHFKDQTVELGISQLRDALNKIQVNLNPTGIGPDVNVGIPDAIMNEAISQVTQPVSDALTGAIANEIPGRYGRCGGMAFAGLDFYLAGWPVDQRFGTMPPASGPLRDFIWNRLLDSLDQNGGRFLSWTMELTYLPAFSRLATAALLSAAGNAGGPIGAAVGAFIGSKVDVLNLGGATPVLHNTSDEWKKLKAVLDMEAARPIGLIYGDSTLPTDQHQILAIGYADPGDGTASLEVWDNNDGAQSATLNIDFRGNELQVTGNRDGRPIKGIFGEDYFFAQPPLSLKLS
jgi:hypothetical protein